MPTPTEKDILELGRDEPIVHQFLSLHYSGVLNYYQALMGMVIAYSKLTNDLMEERKEILLNQPFPSPYNVEIEK